MDFLELLDRYGHSVNDCAVVTLGTDGLDPVFNQILCASILPIVGDEAPVTTYIEGGDIWTSAPYTAINEVTYQLESISRILARKKIREQLKKYPILIGHNGLSFTCKIMSQFDRIHSHATWLDTLHLSRYMYETIPAGVKYAADLKSWQRELIGKVYDKNRSWRLSDLCQFDPGDYYNLPEKNAVRTKSLFIYLLGRQVPIPSNL